MQVKLIPEGLIVDAFPSISEMDNLLIKYLDESIVRQKGRRWDYRIRGTYEIIEVEPHEQRFINRH